MGQKSCRASALISVANECDNPLDKLSSNDHSFDNQKSLKVSLSCHRWHQLDKECQQWMLDLTEDNMKTYYESSSCGWNGSAKRKEFADKTSRHLIVKSLDTNQMIAFIHFRFEVGGNDSECVIYCYELQVVASHQRSGVGQYLMGCLYGIGRAFHMQKVMLTVFKCNTIAMNFYTKSLKYRIDRSSPSRCQMVADYEILCHNIDNKSKLS